MYYFLNFVLIVYNIILFNMRNIVKSSILALTILAAAGQVSASSSIFDGSKGRKKDGSDKLTLRSLEQNNENAFSLSSLRFHKKNSFHNYLSLNNTLAPNVPTEVLEQRNNANPDYITPVQIEDHNRSITINVKVKLGNPIPFIKAPSKSNYER